MWLSVTVWFSLGFMDGALTGDEQTRRQLDTEMDARREDLELTWRQVAEAAGIHYETIRAARKGRAGIPEQTRRAIEKGLRWEQGSVDAILRGGKPTLLPATEPRTDQEPDPLKGFLDRLRGLILRMPPDRILDLLDMFPEVPEAERYQLLRRITRLKAQKERGGTEGDDHRKLI